MTKKASGVQVGGGVGWSSKGVEASASGTRKNKMKNKMILDKSNVLAIVWLAKTANGVA